MANDNPIQNPNMGKEGIETRFTSANASELGRRGAIAKWSIRGWQRYFAAHGLKQGDDLKKFLGEEPSMAQNIAFKNLCQAQDGDLRAAELVTDNIEGKLPQTTINADLEAVKRMTDDELRSTIAAGLSILAKTGNGSEGSHAPGSATGSEAAQEAGTATTL